MLKEQRTFKSFFPWMRTGAPTVKDSEARNNFEFAALDQKRETLRRKLEVLSEVSFNMRLRAEQESLRNPVEEQDDLLMEYNDAFHALEQRRENMLTRKPEDRFELERWYRGKADDFRRLGEEMSLLVTRVDDLALMYYRGSA